MPHIRIAGGAFIYRSIIVLINNRALLPNSKILINQSTGNAYYVWPYLNPYVSSKIFWQTAVRYILKGQPFALEIQPVPDFLCHVQRLQRFARKILKTKSLIVMCLHHRIAKGSKFEHVPSEVLHLILKSAFPSMNRSIPI